MSRDTPRTTASAASGTLSGSVVTLGIARAVARSFLALGFLALLRLPAAGRALSLAVFLLFADLLVELFGGFALIPGFGPPDDVPVERNGLGSVILDVTDLRVLSLTVYHHVGGDVPV